MATEFQTVLDHGTYVLNARVVSSTKTVELFLVGEREGSLTHIVENGGFPFTTFEMSLLTDNVDVFRGEYSRWLDAGGKEALEAALNPISAFNTDTVVVEEPEAPKVEAKKPAPKAKAKPKPKAK